MESVRVLPPPEELAFTVDEKVRGDIGRAKKQYFESVSGFRERQNKRFECGRWSDSRLSSRPRTCRSSATPSRLSEKPPSSRKSCTRTRSSNWRCSWRTLNCTRGMDFTQQTHPRLAGWPGMSSFPPPRSSQARMLLRDSHDSQVLPRQDGDHEALHRGGGEMVHGHDGPVVRGGFFKVEAPLWMARRAGLDAWRFFCFRTTRRGKPCSWPLRNTTGWWPRPRKDEVSLGLMGRPASEYFLLRRPSRLCRLWQAPFRPVSYRQRGGSSGSGTLLRSALCQEVLRGKRR